MSSEPKSGVARATPEGPLTTGAPHAAGGGDAVHGGGTGDKAAGGGAEGSRAAGVPVRASAGGGNVGHRKVWLAAAGLGAVMAVGTGVAWAVAGGQREEPAAVSRADVPVQDGGVLRFSPEFSRRMGLQAGVAEIKRLTPTVRVTGTVAHDPRRVAEIGARVEGRVAALRVVEGDVVAEGAPVVEIDSVELGRAQALVRSARARELAAEANYQRESRLVEARVSATRDAEIARAELAAARAEREAAEQTVRALGGGTGGATGRLVLRTPIAGHVIRAAARTGQTVAPTDTLVVVADAREVWVELAVFEGELDAIRPGDVVRISPQTEREVVLEGRVAHVAEVIDLETRTAHVRVSVPNPSLELRVGESVIADIATTGNVREVLTIPRDALTSVDGKDTVFVVRDERGGVVTAVEPRTVRAGARDGTHAAILEGLRAGDRVIVAGTFALKSELFR
jgi:cobalt-zinc-cadmium efflux system membrane fusion protein